MSTKDEILALLADGSEWSAAAIREALPDLQSATVAWALGSLVENDELERIKPGFYRVLPGTEKRARPPSVRTRFTPPPEPAQDPQEAAQQPAEPEEAPEAEDAAAEPLQWALWHDGDLLIRRGEASVVLTLDEVTRLHAWLEAMRTAVQVGRVAA